MKIILKEKVKGLGDAGEVVNVKDGYARNYLLPKGLAVDCSQSNLKILEIQKELKKHHEDTEFDKSQSTNEKLSEKFYTISVKAGEDERLYGSVTSKDISNILKDDGFDIDRKDILIDEPIKKIGVYSIGARLHPKLVAHFKLSVVKEEVEAEEETPEIEKPALQQTGKRLKTKDAAHVEPKAKDKKQKIKKPKKE